MGCLYFTLDIGRNQIARPIYTNQSSIGETGSTWSHPPAGTMENFAQEHADSRHTDWKDQMATLADLAIFSR